MAQVRTAEQKAAWERWQQHCREVRELTPVSMDVRLETPTQRSARIRRLLSDYDAFCEYYYPHYLTLRDKATGEVIRTVHNAPFHTAAARKIRSTPNLKAAFKWPRAHAKSTHIGIMTPTWLMFQPVRLINFMVLVGKSEKAAKRLLGDIQAELENNQRLIADFGEQKNTGSWEEGEFKTLSGIKFLAVGRGQSPRGLRDREARPDYIVIDDIDDDELCRNEKRVQDMTAWVKEALFGALDLGRGRFIIVGNLISKTSVLASICASKGVYVSEVMAVDADGNPTWKDKWTREEARVYADFVGYRAWQKEMMHNPIKEGMVFRNEWIRYKKMPPLGKYDMLVCYTDPSFKGAASNDYKACRLWGKIGTELHLIDTYVRQDSVSGMVRWLYDLYERIPQDAAVTFYMEANFMQDIILDEFETEGRIRGYQLPIMPDTRKKPDKLQRIEAVSPLWERGLVWYNEALKGTPDMETGIDQTLSLGPGSRSHDDAPDADEGAIWFLQRYARSFCDMPVVVPRSRPSNSW
nr:MAG TPA: Large Terminase [Caudoviricetes sp.]